MSKFVKLSSIATLTVGFVGTMAKHYTESGVPLLRSLNIKPFKIVGNDMKYVSAEFSNSISKSILHKGDVVIVRTGIPGTCCVVPEEYDGCNCSDVVIVHPNTSLVDPHYLAAFINVWGQRQVQNNKVGAIQQHFNVHSAEEMLIFLPDLDDQKRIAAVIIAMNSKIENNNSVCIELESMAKTIYDYWFTQFDFPDADGKPYRSSGGAMVWNEQLKREIPKGWIVAPLSQYLNCNKHSVHQKDKFDSICYLDTGSLTDNAMDSLECYESISVAPVRAQRIVYQNDILYSTVRPIQRHYGIIKHPAKNMVASSGFACLSSKTDSKYNDLFYLFITAPQNTKKLCAIADSSVSAYPSINPSDILDLQIALPKYLGEIDELVSSLSRLLYSKAHWQDETRQLFSLRDWLFPMLVNGQATVG
mgnify:CR=1 FL=1